MPGQFLHGVEVIEIDDGIRAIRTPKSSIIGLVGTAPDALLADWPADTPILCVGPRQAATLGEGGTLKDAYEAIFQQGATVVIIVRVDEGVDAAATLANVVGDAAQMTGVYALLQSKSVVKATPRILCAPGFTSDRPGDTANPVVASLQVVAEKTRSVLVADGPNTNEADALAYRADWGSDRIFIVDPAVRVFDSAAAQIVTRPASGYVAGLIAKRDLEKGFWWSPSNQIITGVTGIARPITFDLSDSETEANRLNEGDVATVVHEVGYRLWGNRSAASDPNWAFINVRRTADLVYDAIEGAHLWAMDRPFSAQLIRDIQGTVQGYLRELNALGAILGGEVWLDPELNTEATLKAGKLYIDFSFEPPAPLEHLIFQARRDGDAYSELFAEVTNA